MKTALSSEHPLAAPRLNLFGTLRVAYEGRTLSIPPGPLAARLGYLALQGTSGRSIPRSRLAGALWPDQPEARARRALADTLYRLRRLAYWGR